MLKCRESTRLWTARVRFLHSSADICAYICIYVYICVRGYVFSCVTCLIHVCGLPLLLTLTLTFNTLTHIRTPTQQKHAGAHTQHTFTSGFGGVATHASPSAMYEYDMALMNESCHMSLMNESCPRAESMRMHGMHVLVSHRTSSVLLEACHAWMSFVNRAAIGGGLAAHERPSAPPRCKSARRARDTRRLQRKF